MVLFKKKTQVGSVDLLFLANANSILFGCYWFFSSDGQDDTISELIIVWKYGFRDPGAGPLLGCDERMNAFFWTLKWKLRFLAIKWVQNQVVRVNGWKVAAIRSIFTDPRRWEGWNKYYILWKKKKKKERKIKLYMESIVYIILRNTQ